jgi:hypothetical protein
MRLASVVLDELSRVLVGWVRHGPMLPVLALHLMFAVCWLLCRTPKDWHVSTEKRGPQAKTAKRPPDLLRLIPEDVLDH